VICDGGPVLIYKILLPSEWAALQAAGTFDGSPFDHESGFVHCSSREQVGRTAARVFGQEPALVVAAVDADVLGGAVRWEAASHGDVYPHIYAPLPLSAVVAVYEVPGAAAVDEVLSREESA
jgi:uncharacterized protein (DUF952 family)